MEIALGITAIVGRPPSLVVTVDATATLPLDVMITLPLVVTSLAGTIEGTRTEVVEIGNEAVVILDRITGVRIPDERGKGVAVPLDVDMIREVGVLPPRRKRKGESRTHQERKIRGLFQLLEIWPGGSVTKRLCDVSLLAFSLLLLV